MSAACPGNLGPRQARQRLLVGIAALLAGVSLAWLAWRHPPLAWLRWALVPTTFLVVLQVLQARTRT